MKNRLKEHLSGEAALWTSKRLPVHLIYFESYTSLLDARRRERQVKGWVVKKKEHLIMGRWSKKYRG